MCEFYGVYIVLVGDVELWFHEEATKAWPLTFWSFISSGFSLWGRKRYPNTNLSLGFARIHLVFLLPLGYYIPNLLGCNPSFHIIFYFLQDSIRGTTIFILHLNMVWTRIKVRNPRSFWTCQEIRPTLDDIIYLSWNAQNAGMKQRSDDNFNYTGMQTNKRMVGAVKAIALTGYGFYDIHLYLKNTTSRTT